MNCLNCKVESGSLVLCNWCQKTTKKNSSLWKKATIVWHNTVVGDCYQCSYCKKVLPRDMLAGDHIFTKASRPDLRFDVSNGVACCMQCNDSNVKYKMLAK